MTIALGLSCCSNIGSESLYIGILDLKLLHLLGGSGNFLLELDISLHLLRGLVFAELDGSAARFS